MEHFTKKELSALERGELVRLGNGKLYGLCANCRTIVRLNKPILGDLHICELSENRKRAKD